MPLAQPANPDPVVESRQGEFLIRTDHGRLDLEVIHGFRANCDWAKGIPRDVVARSIEHSLCCGGYDGSGAQVGFARVISDFAAYASIADVFVVQPHRGHGLGKHRIECIVQHRALPGFGRWNLTTQRRSQVICTVRLYAPAVSGEIHGRLAAKRYEKL